MRFTKTLVALSAFLLAAGPVSAQDELPRPFRFGLLVGRSISNVTDIGISEALVESSGIVKESRNAVQFGAFATFPMGRVFSLQPEMHYVQKGVSFELSGTGGFPGEDPEPLPGGAEFALKLAYLEVPLLARVDFARSEERRRLFLVAGPTVSLRGACQYALKVDVVDVQFPCDEGEVGADPSDETDQIRKFDYGLIGGGGVAFRFFGLPMSVEGRYGRSLSPLAREATGIDAKNTLISVLFGLGF